MTRKPPDPSGTALPSMVTPSTNHTRQRPRRRPRLRRDRPRNRRDHDVPRLRLPPGVDDRATVAADDFAVPHPGFGIDRFAHGAEQAQAAHVVLFRPLVAPLDEGANRGGRGVENVHFVARDDRPETVGLGEIRRAFVHHAGGAVLQRTVDDVAVPGDPSNISGAPVRVLVFEIEDPFGGEIGADGISSGGVNDALRFAGGA